VLVVVGALAKALETEIVVGAVRPEAVWAAVSLQPCGVRVAILIAITTVPHDRKVPVVGDMCLVAGTISTSSTMFCPCSDFHDRYCLISSLMLCPHVLLSCLLYH